jgi:hypothetical protein
MSGSLKASTWPLAFHVVGMHEDGGIETHDVLVELHHALPPEIADVLLQFHTHLAVIIRGTETVINLAAGEYETILFTMANDVLKEVFVVHSMEKLRAAKLRFAARKK